MALDKPYKNVPGTIIFDAEQARKGYQINQLCMSFMKAENRERYLADRQAYLDEWQLTPTATAGDSQQGDADSIQAGGATGLVAKASKAYRSSK